MPQLRVLGPNNQEQWVDLAMAEYVLGRDPKTDIPLQDKKVSRRHARIFRQGGGFFLEDLGSANGVLVDGVPIRDPIELTDGIEVEVGAFVLAFASDPEPAGGLVFSLVGLAGPVDGQTYTLPAADIHVGRGDDSDIVISHGSVSRNHAVLEVDSDKMVVEDLGSSNGTFVNEERVAREPLQHGDRLRFGNIEFEVVVEQTAADAVQKGPGFFARLKDADSSLKLAAAMAVMTVVLLVVVIVIMVAKGRSTAERVDPFIAYEKAVESGLADAQAQLHGESWAMAIRSFREVLDQDPINPAAREGLYAAQLGQQHQAILTAAREDVRAGRPQNAIKRLASIPADSHYAAQTAEMLKSARLARAKQAVSKAEEHCANKEWEQCHDYAIVALIHEPDSPQGQQLVNTAEKKLKRKKIPFTPWAP